MADTTAPTQVEQPRVQAQMQAQMQADNIVQDDFDPVAAMAQFEENEAASSVSTADAYIASMQPDGVWEQHGDKRPAGVHFGVPVPAQGHTQHNAFAINPWDYSDAAAWKPTYTAPAQQYGYTHKPAYGDGEDDVGPDADDRQNEIMDAIGNLETGVDACVDACKQNANIGNSIIQRLERLMKENILLCKHIITIESVVMELQAGMGRLAAQLACMGLPAAHTADIKNADTSATHIDANTTANHTNTAPTHTVDSTTTSANTTDV